MVWEFEIVSFLSAWSILSGESIIFTHANEVTTIMSKQIIPFYCEGQCMIAITNSQDLCRPFLSTQTLIRLHYLRSTIFPLPGV